MIAPALVALPAVAVAGLALATNRRPGQRVVGALLAAGVLAYAWTCAFYAADDGAAAAFPSIADAGLLVFYPVLIVVTTLRWRMLTGRRLRARPLDATIAGLALAALGDVVLASHAGAAGTSTPALGRAVYVNADLFVAGYALVAGVLQRWPPPARPSLIAASLLVLAVTDGVYAARIDAGHMSPGALVLAGWAGGMVVLGAGLAWPVTPDRSSPGAALVAIPALAGAVALPIVIGSSGGDAPFRRVVAISALLLAGLRLGISLVDNLRLVAAADAAAGRQAAIARLGRHALEGAPIDELTAEAAGLTQGGEAVETPPAATVEAVDNVLVTAGARLVAEAEIRELAAARRRLVVEALASEERERRRIAQSLHDTALQELLAAAQELDQAVPDLAAPDAEHAARARSSVRRAGRDLRDAVTELHPVVLERAGVGAAIDAMAQRVATRSGLRYTLDVDAEAARGAADVLVPLARELLANVARHAHASAVRITIRGAGRDVVLEVADDGRDAGAGAPPALASWKERVEALGGTMGVTAPAGGGTVVRVALPRTR